MAKQASLSRPGRIFLWVMAIALAVMAEGALADLQSDQEFAIEQVTSVAPDAQQATAQVERLAKGIWQIVKVFRTAG